MGGLGVLLNILGRLSVRDDCGYLGVLSSKCLLEILGWYRIEILTSLETGPTSKQTTLRFVSNLQASPIFGNVHLLVCPVNYAHSEHRTIMIWPTFGFHGRFHIIFNLTPFFWRRIQRKLLYLSCVLLHPVTPHPLES